MTYCDYLMTMKKVKIADFKARLSEHLRYVRRGHRLTILDRDTPIASVAPVDEAGPLSVRGPLGRHRTVSDVPLPPPLRLDVDAVALLLKERQGER